MRYLDDQVNEFLRQSNAIENERSEAAFQDAKLAWAYALRKREGMTVKNVLRVHAILMRQLRPDIAGKLRACPVTVGGRVVPFVSVALISQELREWLGRVEVAFGSAYGNTPRLEGELRQLHVEFERLHGFQDGNGRVGRILWQVQRLRANLPIEIIYEHGKEDYYRWFDE